MRLLIQRVNEAKVTVDEKVVGEIGKGFLIFLGIESGDTEKEVQYYAEKLAHLRIFEDAQGKMNRSLIDEAGEVLVISQFTLCADTKTGRRPSFIGAMRPEKAEGLYEKFLREMKQYVGKVERGKFGAHMHVHLVNDGPSTFILPS